MPDLHPRGYPGWRSLSRVDAFYPALVAAIMAAAWRYGKRIF